MRFRRLRDPGDLLEVHSVGAGERVNFPGNGNAWSELGRRDSCGGEVAWRSRSAGAFGVTGVLHLTHVLVVEIRLQDPLTLFRTWIWFFLKRD